jgi:hypothetical protein
MGAGIADDLCLEYARRFLVDGLLGPQTRSSEMQQREQLRRESVLFDMSPQAAFEVGSPAWRAFWESFRKKPGSTSEGQK